MVTLSDVAALAGVSVSAASRVLSAAPNARVSATTRARVREAAAQLDYRPNFAARALKSQRTHVVALVVPDVTNAIFADLLRGVEDAAARLGYTVLLARTEGGPDRETVIPRLVGEGRVDGVLVQIGDEMPPEDLSSLLSGRVPAVLVNSTHRGHVGSVALDDEAAVEVATNHLIALGHRRIALMNGLPITDTARRRAVGFRSAMTAAGLTVPEEFVTDLGYQPAQGRAALRVLMALPEPPTAIVVANANAALGVLAEAHALGVQVPGELSIVAIHDQWVADSTWPPLTTVRMPLYELGTHSMAAIAERIATGEVRDERLTTPPPLLIVRESTGAIAAP
jgi:DNA-binding LacI/PurR family transcriptional regulator